jgi:allantoinase
LQPAIVLESNSARLSFCEGTRFRGAGFSLSQRNTPMHGGQKCGYNRGDFRRGLLSCLVCSFCNLRQGQNPVSATGLFDFQVRGGKTMLPLERITFSPINDRLRLGLPNGGRLVVWVIVNVEEWNPRETMPRTVLTPPAGGSPMPDIPNWAWHEYGNRVGFWRFLEVFDHFKIRAALAINGSAIQAYQPIARAALERGWEFVGHGFGQKNMQKVPDEREDIAKTTSVIRQFTGKRPRGWLGPGLTETWDTPDILAEEGYEYVCDWVLDDQPVVLKTRSGTIVSVPYTQECNDVAMMLIQHHSGTEYRDRAIDQFEQLYADSRESARIMALVVHPYIMGVPHRLRYFREALEHIRSRSDVLFWTGEQILDWYLSVTRSAAHATKG